MPTKAATPLSEDIAEGMPRPTDGFGPEEQAPTPEIDAKGTLFDPAVHKSAPGGGPFRTAKGNFARKPGRKSHTKDTSAGSIVYDGGTDSQYQLAGRGAMMLTVTCGVLIGGQSFMPTQDEEAQLTHAWANWMESRGIEDIPPGLALTAAIAIYAIPRFKAPETATRLRKVGNWFKSRVAWTKRQRGRPSDNGSIPDLPPVEPEGLTDIEGMT